MRAADSCSALLPHSVVTVLQDAETTVHDIYMRVSGITTSHRHNGTGNDHYHSNALSSQYRWKLI